MGRKRLTVSDNNGLTPLIVNDRQKRIVMVFGLIRLRKNPGNIYPGFIFILCY